MNVDATFFPFVYLGRKCISFHDIYFSKHDSLAFVFNSIHRILLLQA